jgi:hypothetical protein
VSGLHLSDAAAAATDATLGAALALAGAELAFLGRLDGATFTYLRLGGTWPGLAAGDSVPAAASFCQQMVRAADGAVIEPGVGLGAAVPVRLGVGCYAGVPVRRPDGGLIATLGAFAHRRFAGDRPLDALRQLRGVLAAILAPATATGASPLVLRRRDGQWAVAVADGAELPVSGATEAMVLADLLTEDLSPGRRPPRAEGGLTEIDRLKLAIAQLEHALAARVTVEQSIGVLAERMALTPREAFERLRRAARGRGQRVHELAAAVVRSAADRTTVVPEELRPARPGPVPRPPRLPR